MRIRPIRRSGCAERGFTLFEALISIALAAIAAAALLLGLMSSNQTTEFGYEQAIALGIAEQLANEIVGKRYVGRLEDPYGTSLGASVIEENGNRIEYDDIDDFDQFTAKPPQSPMKMTLGEDDGEGQLRHPNFRLAPPNFDQWREYVEVYFVSDSDPATRLSAGQTSSLKAVEVHVFKKVGDGVEKELANVRRVIGYIPSP